MKEHVVSVVFVPSLTLSDAAVKQLQKFLDDAGVNGAVVTCADTSPLTVPVKLDFVSY